MVTVKKDELLRRHTTFRIGGPAREFYLPENESELVSLVKKQPQALILGGGSNLLISDSGLEKVICMKNLKGYTSENASGGKTEVTVLAGNSLTVFAHAMWQMSLSGLEFAFGIPGSVGGAVVMNAGAAGGEIKDSLLKIKILLNGKLEEMPANAIGFSYRSSNLPESAVVLSATFSLIEGDANEIWEKMQTGFAGRKKSQPLELPSAGSVFKNPPGRFAGKIIEELGLKGTSVGGAQVSRRHANFIVNSGNATAQEVYALMDKIKSAALEKRSVHLEPEIKTAGSFN
jgi:UDP-N-acetylmuramate dehydrogenase